MKLERMEYKQVLKTDLKTAWEFLSAPENLGKITPPHMQFQTLSGGGIPMHAGQIIQYKISPFPGTRMNWVTEITHVQEGEFFVDEQRFGPYAFWHHQHHIKAHPDGVEMIDILHYRVPFGFIGKIVNAVLIRSQVKNIFSYRYNVLEKLFNGK